MLKMGCEDILFMTCLIPHELYDEVRSKSKNNMQDAANALQWHLVEGFSFHLGEKLNIINVLPVASYPGYYREASVKEAVFNEGVPNESLSVGFNNVKIIRKESIFHSLYKAAGSWCKSSNASKTVICYGLNVSMLKALTKLKRKYPDISVCAIVADLPDMVDLSAKEDPVRHILGRISAALAYRSMECIDRYVFLTKHMSDHLNNRKPFCVMEGIASGEFEDIPYAENREPDIKTILYTGTLHRKFGVLNLLEAFSGIKEENYRLVICGKGDSEEEIKKAEAEDFRISYMGQLSRSEILKLQKTATVLVNPRMNNEEFTKYSFPSKNLEYLSSGVPVIAYKLDGIPDEYDDYIIYTESNEPSALAKKLVETASLSDEERRLLGKKAQDFVLEQKNPVVQTKKILSMIGF